MALVHPSRAGAPLRRERPAGKPLHPAIGLAGGFGLIVLIAVVVHIVFGLVL